MHQIVAVILWQFNNNKNSFIVLVLGWVINYDRRAFVRLATVHAYPVWPDWATFEQSCQQIFEQK